MSDVVRPYRELERDALRALAERTIADAAAPPEHVARAMQRLAVGEEYLLARVRAMPPPLVIQLRRWLESMG